MPDPLSPVPARETPGLPQVASGPGGADPASDGSRLLEPGGSTRLGHWLSRGGPRFRMAMVEAATPAAREELIGWLAERWRGDARELHRVDLADAVTPADDTLLGYLRRCFPAPPREVLLVLYNLESALWKPERGLLEQLNIQRDLFTREFPCPWVFFVHPTGRLPMVHRAPDFFDFVSLRVAAADPETPALPASALTVSPHPDWNRSPGPPPLVVGGDASGCETRLLTYGDAEGRAEERLGNRLRAAWEALDHYALPHAADLIEQADLSPGGEHSPWLPVLRARLAWLRGDLNEAPHWLDRAPAPAFPVSPPAAAAATLLRATLLARRGDTHAAEILARSLLSPPECPHLLPARASALALLADLRATHGDLDEALRLLLDECLPAYAGLRDARSEAITRAQIAALRQMHGDRAEALRLLQHECLPTFERLGDERSRAITWGQIAALRQAQGDYDEALRLLQHECLPAFERLQDERSRAITWNAIADLRQLHGDLNEALHILQSECLPVYGRLQDVRSRAITWGQIAGIRQARGELGETLRILQFECLPGYEQLGDTRCLLVGRAHRAIALFRRSAPGDREEAARLLPLALAAAEQMRLPEAEQIRGLMRQMAIAP